MQLTLKCKISLSKKMRSILQNGGQIILTSDPITSGKGDGILVMTDKSNEQIDLTDLLGKETSIMITPTEAFNSQNAPPVSNLFANVAGSGGVGTISSQQPPQQPQYQQPQYAQPPQQYQQPQYGNPQYDQPQHDQSRTPIDRMAVTQPPPHGQNNSAYYQQNERQVPQQFQQTQEPDFIKFVKTYEELIHKVKESKDKQSDIRLEHIHNNRERAVAEERKDMEESIGTDAYVVNEKCASLAINDINLVLPLNMPRNLGNISAKRLASSRELWSLFKQGMIRIVSPTEAQHLLKNAGNMSQTYVPELEIYDSKYDAEDNTFSGPDIGGGGMRTPVLDLEMGSLDGPSEEMQNLRMAGRQQGGRVAQGGSVSDLAGTRRSFHGSGGGDEESLDIFSSDEYKLSKRHVDTQSLRNSKGMKTVASRHRP